MQNIQQQITQNFQDNIEYFSQNHPDIYEKIAAFDSAVEQGAYTPRYELTYEDGGFDLFEKATQKYFYAKQSLQYSKLAQQSVDTSIEENCFVAFVKHKEFTKKSDTPFMFADDGLTPIAKLTQQEEVKKFDKYIFFGLGLGIHLEAIVQKIEPKVCFLVEQDLELFRNSLLTTNYKELAKKTKLVFSVFDDDLDQATQEFLAYKYHYNHYIKYFLMFHQNQSIVEQFYNILNTEPYFYYMYNDLLKHIVKPFKSFEYGTQILTHNVSLSAIEKPFLLLGAGPSLEHQIKWLQKNHKNFIIVALSATLALLQKYNIQPDIITHIDSFKAAKAHFQNIQTSFLEKSILIASATIEIEIQTKFQKKKVFLFENGTNYIKQSIKIATPCSGSASYQLLLQLHVKNLYLLGLDLAVDSKTKQTHITTHSSNKILHTNNENSYKKRLFPVQGNKQNQVLTTPHFKTSIDSVNLSTKLFKQESTTIYNCSNGAYFENTLPVEIQSIIIKHQNDINLEKILHQFSINTIDIELLKEKITFYKECKTKIKLFQQKSFIDYSEFLHELEEFSYFFIQEKFLKTYELCRVFDLYFHKSLVFIFQTDSGNIKEIQTFFTNHLQQMIDFYNTKAINATY